MYAIRSYYDLSELKNLELIKGTTEGVKVNYCINPDKLQELKQVLSTFRITSYNVCYTKLLRWIFTSMEKVPTINNFFSL